MKVFFLLLSSIFISHGEVIRDGIVDEIHGKSFKISISAKDIESICTVSENEYFVSPSNPESSENFPKILSRAREQLIIMNFTNRDGSQLAMSAFNISRREFGEYRLWIASISYLQTISKNGDPVISREVSIAIPLDTIPMQIESTP